MKRFEHFKQTAEQQKPLTRKLIDDFLIYYAADKDKLSLEADLRMKPFRHIIHQLPHSWPGMFKSQYIAHRIFKQGGLIQKYLRHSALKSLSPSEREFLEFQLQHPWQFSFSRIIDNPDEHVYAMKDVFREQEYYLYSPGMTNILEEQSVKLWFNLETFNGECRETYGPIAGFQAFDEDDIFFFATEINPALQFTEELTADVERNPTAYALLISGAKSPVIMQEEDEMIQHAAWMEQKAFTTDQLNNRFEIAYNTGVYRLTLKAWRDFPHFAQAYYDEEQQELVVTALTERGFAALSGELRKCGFAVGEADVRVRLSMVSTAGEILRREIDLNPYEELFQEVTAPETDEFMEKVNRVLQLALPFINNDKQPDIDALAAQAGVDPDDVREVIEKSIAHLKESRNRLS